MENEKVEENRGARKSKTWIVVILLLVLCVVVGFCCFQLGMNYSNKEESNSNQEGPKGVPEEVVEELKEIIGYETSGDQFLHRMFMGANGVIDQLDSGIKLSILDFATADSRKTLPNDYDEICVDMDECSGIPITAIETAAKKYGITNPTKLFDEEESFVKSGDYYIWLGSGYGIASSIKSSNFKASYQGEDIIVEEDITETYSDETEEQGKYHLRYTFKKDTEKNYYLYSVTSKDA